MTDTATEALTEVTGYPETIGPWTTDGTVGGPVTLDVPVTFRATLTPANTPDDVAFAIAANGPDVTADAARNALRAILTDALVKANEGSTYLSIDLVPTE